MLRKGRLFWFPINYALLRGVKRGDVLDNPLPERCFTFAGGRVVVDYSDQQGSILIDRSVYKRLLERFGGEYFPRVSNARRI